MISLALAAHGLVERSEQKPRPMQICNPNSLYPYGLDMSPWLRRDGEALR